MNRVSPKVLALLAGLTLIWGTSWTLFRIALDALPPWTFRIGVMLVASVLLGVLVHLRGESFAVPQGRWPALIAASILNLGYWNIASALAVLYLPSGHASVLTYTMPLWVALLGFALFGQRLSGRLMAAIAIGALAVAALMAPNFASYANAPWGLFWALSAAAGWALGTFVVKRTDWPGMGLSLTFWQVILCLPPMVVGTYLVDGVPQHWPSPAILLVMVYAGAVPMAFGTLIWFALVKALPAQVAALSTITVPIVAVLSGIVVLHEPLSLLQAVAVASTMISLWLALVPPRGVV